MILQKGRALALASVRLVSSAKSPARLPAPSVATSRAVTLGKFSPAEDMASLFPQEKAFLFHVAFDTPSNCPWASRHVEATCPIGEGGVAAADRKREKKRNDLGEKIPPSQNSVAEERPDIETLKVFGKGTGKPFFSKRVPREKVPSALPPPPARLPAR